MKEGKVNILSKRISAYLIDILFVFILIGLITGIKYINPYYEKYNNAYQEYNDLLEDYSKEKIEEKEFTKGYNETYYLISKYSVSYNIVIICGLILYFGVFQKYNNGQTLGKKIMKIQVVSTDNEKKVDLFKMILRTIPMYYIYIGSIVPIILNNLLLLFVHKNQYVTFVSTISYIFLIINIVSFILVLKRKDQRGIHDLISNTKVIYIGK